MKAKIGIVSLVLALLLVSTVSAAGLSIQLKRTNPGIAGTKSAEIIFDVVNTDLTHQIEGFLLCRSPDDAVVEGTAGVGTGAAQYVGPLFLMDEGPSQRAMSLTIGADSPGDKRTGCTVKYSPFKETVTEGTSTTESIEYSGVVTADGEDVSGYTVAFVEFIEAVEATDETEAEPAKATISVDGEVKDIEVGKSGTIGDLKVEVTEATEANATVDVTGTKTITTEGTTVRQYLKMNGQYVSELRDDQYREIRLDKTIPFVKDMSDPECPEGKKDACKANEVVDMGGIALPGGYLPWLLGAVIVIVLLVFYLLGKTSRKS